MLSVGRMRRVGRRLRAGRTVLGKGGRSDWEREGGEGRLTD
jgi:hypothetical protein